MSLSIGTDMVWTILLTTWDKLNDADKKRIGDGLALVLFQHLQTSVFLTLPQLVAHKVGSAPQEQLALIEHIAKERKGYLASL